MLCTRFWGYPCVMVRGTPKIAFWTQLSESYGHSWSRRGRTWVVPNKKTPKIWVGDFRGTVCENSSIRNWLGIGTQDCILRFLGMEIGTHENAVWDWIHWHRIGTRTKASRVDMELKVASHYRTFREMECPQTLALMQKFSIQGLSKKSVHIIWTTCQIRSNPHKS